MPCRTLWSGLKTLTRQVGIEMIVVSECHPRASSSLVSGYSILFFQGMDKSQPFTLRKKSSLFPPIWIQM